MLFNFSYFTVLAILLVAGCDNKPALPASSKQTQKQQSLDEVRQGFTTRLIRKQVIDEPVVEPPENLFRSISYQSSIGDMAAYVSPSPEDGRKHPAIIWIVGGFANSVSEIAWQPGPAENDQSGSAFRKAGIIMMYPSLRGGNKNPGYLEGFYGEVDDILAAADFLAKQDYVDAKRIYLGGHSTGGTLALLVAESTDRFRTVFSFGPVGDISGYGQEMLPFRISDRQECDLRSPAKWLHSIRNPTFVFEGTDERSNVDELILMSRLNRNTQVHFHPIKGVNHFSILAPISQLVAEKILQDTNSADITFSGAELIKAVR